jgi:hypothetical protein
MGMTLIQLMKKQPPYIVNHAETVRLLKYDRRVAPKTGLPAVIAHLIDPESGNAGHHCQIVSIESPRLRNPSSVKAGWVKVSCSCDFFKYYCEYSLNKWGAANIRHSNGEPASFTNPTNYPLMCKHLFVLGKRASK